MKYLLFALVFVMNMAGAISWQELERGLQPSKKFGYFYNMAETPEFTAWVTPELFHTQYTTSYDGWTYVEVVYVYRKPIQSKHMRHERVMLNMVTAGYVITCDRSDGKYQYQTDWQNEFDTDGNSIGLFSVRGQPVVITNKQSLMYRIAKVACYDLMNGAGNKVYRNYGGLWDFPWKVRPVNKEGSGVFDYNEGLRWFDKILGE